MHKKGGRGSRDNDNELAFFAPPIPNQKGEKMGAYAVGNDKLIRELRAKLRQKEFHIVQERRKSSDRRIAFFSYYEYDRRIGERRYESNCR